MTSQTRPVPEAEAEAKAEAKDTMNRLEKVLRRVDAAQQRFGPAALVFGVVKKFGDDNAGTLVASLCFSAFLCVFPLLLIFITVLDIVLVHDSGAYNALRNSTLHEFPIVGTQLGKQIHGLQRSSVIGLIVGLLGLLWGSTGLAQSGLFSMAQIWNLTGPERPNYLERLGRSVAFLAVLGLGLVVTTGLAGFGTFGRHNIAFGTMSEAGALLINVATYCGVFRVLTPKAVPGRQLLPGAIFGGAVWTILQAVGGYVIGHDLKNDSSTYGTFGLVLGLVAWIYLGSRITLYAAELNTVLAGRLWPRGLVQPPLTEADQRSLTRVALQNQRRPEQSISVSFTTSAMSQSEWLSTRDGASGGGGEGGMKRGTEGTEGTEGAATAPAPPDP
jgi:YihY family inner membrane protein